MEQYDYIITKPELNDETLAHFLGGAHKYLKKYMGKNGKWVYVYNKAKKGLNDAAYKAKNKLYDLSVRSERRKLGFIRPEDVSLVRQHTVKNGRRYLVGLGYRGDDGRARSTGSSSGNKGYTLTLDSILAGRRRAKISGHNKLVANKTSKKGIYRPTSRKKRVGKGAGSVKIRGTKGLGLNVKANLMNHRVKGLKTELAIKERERNRKAALRASKNRKAK